MEYKKGSVLSGIKVLDLGQVIAAPYCTEILSNMGADVIKVEMPGKGDGCRASMPMKDGISTYYLAFNCGKRDITLNLKSEKGKEILTKLIKEADVIVENFRPGVFARLGFTYERLQEIKPDIIYAAISGFGQDGPYSKRAGYDPIAQAMSGIMSVTGVPGGQPVRCGASFADVMAAQNTAMGILAALRHRDLTGEGQMIDVALADCCITALASINQIYLTDGTVPQRLGNTYAASAPGNNYATKDGQIILLAGNEKQWQKLCAILGHEEWTTMPEFIDNKSRVAHKAELDALIREATGKFTTEELLSQTLEAGLAVGPILNVQEAVDGPHFAPYREMYPEVQHPQLGKIRVTNQPIRMSKTTPYVRSCAPTLGQHTDEILAELGYSGNEIHEMRETGVV